jgi:hypothetical protein
MSKNLDEIKNNEQVYKRELMYNLKEMNKSHTLLIYTRRVLYILIGLLVICLLYNMFRTFIY